MVSVPILFLLFALSLAAPAAAETGPPSFPLQESVTSSYARIEGCLIHLGTFPTRSGTQLKLANGILLDRDGLALTLHDVAGAKGRLLVSDVTQRIYEGEVFRTDAVSNIGLVKIKDFTFDEKVHSVAEFGDSTALQVGQSALVASNQPGAIHPVLSFGIVSCTDRALPQQRYAGTKERFGSEHHWLQTDAAINWTEVGAPLFDLRGRVLGICVASRRGRVGDDLGFAIPSEYVLSVVRGLQKLETKKDKIPRSFLGMKVGEYSPLTAKDSKMPKDLALTAEDRGCAVLTVERGKAAEHAGIKKGDLIVSIAGRPVAVHRRNEEYKLHRLSLDLPRGEPVEVVLYRKGERMTKTLTPLSATEYGSDFYSEELGLHLTEIDEDRKAASSLPDTSGLWIVAADRKSPAARARLQAGTRIVAIEETDIDSIEDFEDAVRDLLSGEAESLTVHVEVRKNRKWKPEIRILEL